jgi:hypothetical protein
MPYVRETANVAETYITEITNEEYQLYLKDEDAFWEMFEEIRGGDSTTYRSKVLDSWTDVVSEDDDN